MLRKISGGDVLLIGEQPVVHFPEFSLLACTMRGFGGFLGVLMKFERIVTPDVLDLARVDVVPDDLRICVLVIAGAEGTLEIGELDDGHLRVGRALERLFADIHRRRRKSIGSRSSLPLLCEQLM